MNKINRAEIMDIQKIVSINIGGWIDTYNGIFPSEFLNSLKDKYDESVEKCKKKIDEYIVYKIDDEVVGFLRYGNNKKNYSYEYGEIYALYVDSRYQKMGIGQELIKYAFDMLRGKYKYILISTLIQNSANEFYKKMGGKLVGKSIFKILNEEYEENIYLYKL